MTLDDDSLTGEEIRTMAELAGRDEEQEPAGEVRELTLAELKARDEARLAELGPGAEAELPATARPRERDDELLDEIPATDHHLGRFAGWRAVRRPRLIVGSALALAGLAGLIAFYVHTSELRREHLHPLPEVEATLDPNGPRDMTIAEGQMRVELSREAPSINLLHLPDRDITLAPGVDKSSFKVEVREGRTIRIKVLTGEIVETLQDGAEPLLDD